MNVAMLDLAEAMNDVQVAYENLNTSLQHSEEVAETMESLTQLYREIKDLGYCPEVNDKILKFESLESYTKLSAEKIIKYTATESVGEAVKDAAKKFWEAIKLAFQKIMEFFQKTFNTFDNKCRQILLHVGQIDLEKEVMTLTKEKFAKLLVTGKDVQEFMSQSFKRVGMVYQFVRNYDTALTKVAASHMGVLKMSGDQLTIDPKGIEFENKTLKDAGFGIPDCKQLTMAYQDRSKNYSQIGAICMTVVKEVEASQVYTNDHNASYDIRLAIRTQAFVYRLLAKIQSITCKQIIAFYKCIGNAVSINPNYKAPNQIGYAG